MGDFKFEIVENLENLSEKSDTGWVKQLNLVRWGDSKEPVYDIRSWKYDDEGVVVRCGKGVTLNHEELALLCQYAIDNGIAN